MLMKTPHTLVYLSAEELKITERERAGLIEVRDDLASGRMKHAVRNLGPIQKQSYRAFGFNMNMFMSASDCGTSHCIGGFMRANGTLKENYSGALRDVFYPCGNAISVSWDKFTPAQAVRAIDAFLSGAGPDCWDMALADIPPA